jgi:hypothetical protein
MGRPRDNDDLARKAHTTTGPASPYDEQPHTKLGSVSTRGRQGRHKLRIGDVEPQAREYKASLRP